MTQLLTLAKVHGQSRCEHSTVKFTPKNIICQCCGLKWPRRSYYRAALMPVIRDGYGSAGGTIMTVKAVSMSRPVQAQEWAMRQASALVEKHCGGWPLEKQWEMSADIAESLTRVRVMFDATLLNNET